MKQSDVQYVDLVDVNGEKKIHLECKIKKQPYKPKGDLLYERKYKYDNNKKIKKEKCFDNKKNLEYQYEFFYDKIGNIIKQTSYHPQNTLIYEMLGDYRESSYLVKVYDELNTYKYEKNDIWTEMKIDDKYYIIEKINQSLTNKLNKVSHYLIVRDIKYY